MTQRRMEISHRRDVLKQQDLVLGLAGVEGEKRAALGDWRSDGGDGGAASEVKTRWRELGRALELCGMW